MISSSKELGLDNSTLLSKDLSKFCTCCRKGAGPTSSLLVFRSFNRILRDSIYSCARSFSDSNSDKCSLQ
ncbi:hypothetical protein F9Y84_07110 [Pseudoalteromonas peptidolytica]|nr:hypothetical protein [Pseudoalteromonas peptidolytica]